MLYCNELKTQIFGGATVGASYTYHKRATLVIMGPYAKQILPAFALPKLGLGVISVYDDTKREVC